MKKLSVIIPVYNIEDYLSQCIDSLLCNRTDYEILLVDDGSTDGSSLVCDEYANRCDFIEVYHKENGGVSSARNLGLDKARGEYIYFVDGDDWVEGFNSVFSMLDGGELFGVNYDVVDKECNVVKSHALENEKIAVNDYSRYYERHSHALWAFIFRKEIIDRLQLRFCKDLKYAEDWVFVVGYLSQICSITALPKITYKYRMSREGSAMNQKYDRRQVLLHFKAFDMIKAIKPIHECKQYYNKELQECFSYVLNIVIKNLSILDKKQIQKMIRSRLSLTMLFTYNLKFMFKTIIAYINISLLKDWKNIPS